MSNDNKLAMRSNNINAAAIADYSLLIGNY